MTRPVIIMGAGGHAKVVAASLKRLNVEIVGCVVADAAADRPRIFDIEILGSEGALARYNPADLDLVNGLGMLRPQSQRKRVHEIWSVRGWHFASVIDPTAILGPDVDVAPAVQIMAASVIQPGCRIGISTIINTRASVDHDCTIGAHVHVAPGATLSGGIDIGDDSHLGTACTVIEGIRIGPGCMIAAGAVVVDDVRDGETMAGIPARAKALRG